MIDGYDQNYVWDSIADNCQASLDISLQCTFKSGLDFLEHNKLAH